MPKTYPAIKPKREEAKAKEIAELRRENHALKRKVKRLYKEVGKRVGIQDSAEESAEETYEPPREESGVSFCGCDVEPTELVLASKKFLICSECKARKRA